MKPYRIPFLKTLILVSALSSSLVFAEAAVSPVDSTAPVVVACTWADPVTETKIMVAKLLEVLNKDQSAINNNFAQVEKDISTILSPSIDIGKIAAFVAPGPLMRSATPEENKEFEKVLLAFFINSYSTAFKSFNDKVRVTVNPLRPGMDQKDTVQINTVVVVDESGNPNSMIPVALVLSRDKEACQWKYVDFVVDNISAVSNVQSQIFAMKVKTLVELTAAIQKHNDAVLKGM